MLASLTIKNVVLIDQLTINFQSGLCALTGETGAGKSILLDSLGLALGARSDSGLVRKGAEQANVSASFEVSEEHPVLSFLEGQDLEVDATLILRRSVTKEGRSNAFINDQPVSANLMRQVGDMLVEIHGQFNTQNLINPKYHCSLLDEYADHKDMLSSVSDSWNLWKDSEKKLFETQAIMDQARHEEEFYRSSLEDLDALSPKEGEEDSLSSLRSRLMRREQIIGNLNEVRSSLHEMETLSGTIWRSLEKIGEEAQEISMAMNRANAEIQEAMAGAQNLSGDIENSEYSLEEIDNRLFSLKAQARKHGCDIDQLPQKREEIARALNAIENQDDALSALIQEVEKNKKDYQKQAKSLSELRQKIAKKLSNLVMEELPPLKLDKARFEVSVEEVEEDQWSANGINTVQFLVATNPGAEAGRLNKIASGGEIARFMLALKVVLAEVGAANSLVFDEVDSGVGGATAAAVGERLARLAKDRQILVVTHSPQVAAMAQYHWIVAKDGQKNVKTNIIPLSEIKQRREEIARMLAGAEITEEARAAAEKLLEVSVA